MGPRGGSGSGVSPARHAGRAMAADGGGGRELLALIHQHLLRGGFARAARELQAQSGQVTGGRDPAAGEAAGRGGVGGPGARASAEPQGPVPLCVLSDHRERHVGAGRAAGPWLHAGPQVRAAPTWCPGTQRVLPVPAGHPGRGEGWQPAR